MGWTPSTSVYELIKGKVDVVRYTDASASGTGGVWTRTARAYPNKVWQVKWPE